MLITVHIYQKKQELLKINLSITRAQEKQESRQLQTETLVLSDYQTTKKFVNWYYLQLGTYSLN